jgi:hypothetical protein
VQVIVGIAGDRSVHEIGSPIRTVLNGKGRPGRVVSEGHPTDFVTFRTLLPGVPFASDAEIPRGVTERIVACGVDGVADQQFLGFSRCELGRKRHRLVRAKTKSNPEFFRTCSLQSAPLSARRASNSASNCPSRDPIEYSSTRAPPRH